MNNQAYLIAKTPNLQCILFTDDFGPIFVESEPLPNIDKPCISSLALIDVERLITLSPALARSSVSNSTLSIRDNFLEMSICDCCVPIFAADSSDLRSTSTSTTNISRSKAKKKHDGGGGTISTCSNNEQNLDEESSQNLLLIEIQNLRGLQERLLDASIAITKDTDSPKGSIEMFLSRSENIVQEFVSTLTQYRQRKKELSSRKRPRTCIGDIDDDDCLFCEKSILYYRSLYEQCSQIENLFSQNANRGGDSTEQNSNILDINKELKKVSILYHDEESRPHELVMELSDKFPVETPVLTTDLPLKFIAPSFTKQGEKSTSKEHHNGTLLLKDPPLYEKDPTDFFGTTSLLPSIFHHFQTTITKLQPFWQEMDDIDSNCLILEPSLPARRSYVERRIALSESISIHLVFDPENPRSSPLSMRLSGAASEEILLLRKAYQNYVTRGKNDGMSKIPRSKMNQNDENNSDLPYGGEVNDNNQRRMTGWDDQIGIRTNLERCFDLTLPSPINRDENLDFVNECGICYSHHLLDVDDHEDHNHAGPSHGDSTYPNISCSNKNCERKYHKTCLLEWLQSLPNAKVSFDRIHGTCMYCCEPISVKILSTV